MPASGYVGIWLTLWYMVAHGARVRSSGEVTLAKTKSPSVNLFSLLYPQTQKNEIKVSLKYGIALMFQSVL